jgi:hypothetical protein
VLTRTREPRGGAALRTGGSCWAIGLCLALAQVPFAARAAEPTRVKVYSDGLALSIGAGTDYPFVGLQAAYYLQLTDRLWRAAAHASVGAMPGGAGNAVLGGTNFGVMMLCGHKHRALLDLSFGTIGVQSFAPFGTELASHPAWGPSLAAGYEYMAFGGFFFRASIGASYLVGMPLYAIRDRFAVALTPIGIGFKIW